MTCMDLAAGRNSGISFSFYIIMVIIFIIIIFMLQNCRHPPNSPALFLHPCFISYTKHDINVEMFAAYVLELLSFFSPLT